MKKNRPEDLKPDLKTKKMRHIIIGPPHLSLPDSRQSPNPLHPS